MLPTELHPRRRFSLWGLLRSSLLVLVVIVSSGCIVGPDYCGQATPVPDVWHQQLENGAYVGSNELHQWWNLFDDPTLTDLIYCAEKHNVNLYAAYTRISQARSQECIINAARKPTLSATGGLQNSLQSPNSINFGGAPISIPAVSVFALGLDVGWEPDLFGRVERQLQSAEANTCAQVEAYRDVLVTLYGDVAQTYVQIRTLQQQLLIACQNVELQKQSLELARKRVDGGVSPNVDLFQAESTLASTEAEIPSLELQLHQSLNRLSTLLGHYPGAMHCVLANPAPIPRVPMNLPQVVPCDMVRQRPDIRQAERRIMGATADVGAAMAELLPSFRIGGNLGLSAINFSELFEGDSFGYGLGPSFSWPILQGGRIRCQIQLEECEVEEAIANYEQTLLRAAEEVENSIVGFNKNRARAAALARTVEAAQKSLESVLALYRAGQVDFQNVLDTQRTLFQAQNSLAIAQGQIITDLITFYRALGGGWDCNHHCPNRCVRVHCPQRCPPDSVNIPCDGSSTSRYFDTKSEGASESKKTLAERIRDRTRREGDGENSGRSDDGGKRPSDDFFDKTLKDLEERLKESPPDKPRIDFEPAEVTPAEGPTLKPLRRESLREQLPTPNASRSPPMDNFPSVPDPPRPTKTPVPELISDPAELFNLSR